MRETMDTSRHALAGYDRPPGDRLNAAADDEEQLVVAQQVLDRHTTVSATGVCLGCGARGPCLLRQAAVDVFWRAGRLPRRSPGRTRPELIGARRLEPDPGSAEQAGVRITPQPSTWWRSATRP